MFKAPETDDILTLFKGLIDDPLVQNILEPTSDDSDKIFVPEGNVMTEGMEFDYWSRIVIIPRRDKNNAVREDETKAIPYYVHCRVDIQPPNDSSYNVDKAMQAIHKRIAKRADGRSITPDGASQAMPFFRTQRPLNAIKTEYGFYASYAIFKTILT